jgi:hypothetical protein
VTRGWWSQQFAPEGSAAAEGIAKQLGVSSLDPLTVLVREAAQNSWDAHRHDVDTLDFKISLSRLGDRDAAWRRHLSPGPDIRSAIALEPGLHPETVMVVVSDRGTVGLGGPLRASHRAAGEEPPNFVQFLRNVGERSDHEFGGGTYGFGKTIFFRLSSVSTMLVDTHTPTAGPDSRRLMGAALGDSWYDDEDLRYTGRHWWGDDIDGIPDPLLGQAAADVAASLGLPGFTDGRTGTDIVIIAADLGTSWTEDDSPPRSLAEAGQFITSAILWNLWPKMVEGGNGPLMRFTVEVDGAPFVLPSPADVKQLRPFVQALQRVRTGSGTRYTRTVTPREAGVLGVELVAAATARPEPIVAAASPLQGPCHHVARMRTAELVVDYLPGPPHPDPLLGYAAVFKSTQSADTFFAGAEPPTHDDWVEKGLTGTARGVVQGARRFIQKQLSELTTSSVSSGDDAGGTGLGEVALRLAGLVPGGILAVPDTGTPAQKQIAKDDAGSNGGDRSSTAGTASAGAKDEPRTGRAAAPRLSTDPILRIYDGTPYLVARVSVPSAPYAREIEAEAQVVLDDGGVEAETPPGALAPEVLQWRHVEEEISVDGPVLRVPENYGPSDWIIFTSWTPDAVVRIRVRTRGDHRAR